MKTQLPKIVNSIEQSSILRKFSILFLVMSLIPMCVLFYLYSQLKEEGAIQLSSSELNNTLIVVVLGVAVGYFAMRSVVKQIMLLTKKSSQALQGVLSPEDIKSISKGENEIAVLAQSFSVITERLEENLKNLERTKNTLHTVMAKVTEGIANMQNIDAFLQLILETATESLGGKKGVLVVWDEKAQDIKIKSLYSADNDLQLDSFHFSDSERATFNVVLTSRSSLILPANSSNAKPAGVLIAPLLCAPLVMQEKVVGALAISGRKALGNFTEEEMTLLLNISSQIAVAIENARLNSDMERTYFETISALALAVDAKDSYSRGHLERVAEYCVLIAQKMGLPEDQVLTLRDAAKLHDIGKIGIIDDVLCKKGPLNDDEWALMRRHPEIGESIIKPIRSLRGLCDIIRHHHEKLDGTGYPDHLKADQIGLLVRIATVADIYDALTTDRSYRAKMPKELAYETMRRMSQEIDQDIVEVLFKSG